MARHVKTIPRVNGFTIIELIVVMTVIGLLLSIAVPVYLDSLDRGKDQVQAHDLAQMRKAIDEFFADRGSYPEQLEDLVTYRYLRAIPPNPRTSAVDWVVQAPVNGQKGRVFDVAPPAQSPTDATRGTTIEPVSASPAAPGK